VPPRGLKPATVLGSADLCQ